MESRTSKAQLRFWRGKLTQLICWRGKLPRWLSLRFMPKIIKLAYTQKNQIYWMNLRCAEKKMSSMTALTRKLKNESEMTMNLRHPVKKNEHDGLQSRNEPQHDKTNKMTVCPTKTLISLGIRSVWSEPSLCAQWVTWDSRYLHVDSEDWSDWVDAQVDLSLCWAHRSFCWFCHVAAQMNMRFLIRKSAI